MEDALCRLDEGSSFDNMLSRLEVESSGFEVCERRDLTPRCFSGIIEGHGTGISATTSATAHIAPATLPLR